MRKSSILRKSISIFMVAAFVFTMMATNTPTASSGISTVYAKTQTVAESTKTPKYIFLFIGDGMSYPQVTSTADYLGKLKNGNNKVADSPLGFMSFPTAGTATTFDSTSFCPDSASTATSISTGKKTHSGVVNMDESKKVTYETITEKLKKQLGYKIGIVTSVSIDHATPAAFYAHQPSRNNYYEIAVELTKSNFDYFGGGGFLSPTGKNKDQKDVNDIAKEAGYKILNTKQDILKINDKSGKVIAINPVLDDSKALPYAINKNPNSLTLAEFTQKGIDTLKNDKGFFMMVEGGKIDWACHANDAATTIAETKAFSDAVDVAVKFQKQYPEDTLILVTGDHETGGLTIGFSATGYSTYFDKLSNQKISYDEFDKKVKKFVEEEISFEEAMKEVKADFGLLTSKDTITDANKGMFLSDYELQKLKDAYIVTMTGKTSKYFNDEENIIYGGYNPFSVTVTHILNNKAGVAFTSYSHTGLPVPVFAQGLGNEVFEGYYDNTDVFNNLQKLTKVK